MADISYLSLLYEDFQLLQIIDPDKFDKNYADIKNKINEMIDVLNVYVTSLSTHKTSGDHDLRYYIKSELDTLFLNQYNTLNGFIDTHKTSTDHDTRYYTKTLIDGGQLDNRYYTEVEINNLLLSKANDNIVVKLSGNQFINDIKTFALSPQVPTPYNNNDVANKGYVDSTVSGVILGQISDGSLTDAKLSDTSGQIKDRVGVLRTDVDKLEVETDYNNKAIAEMQMFLELESKIPSKDSNKLYTNFINSFIASSGTLDLTSQNYTGTLSTGATSVVVTNFTGFVKGQEISIQDTVSYEDVIISSVVGNTINFKTALVNTYTNPRIYRSNNNQTSFGTSSTTITTYDRTTPVQVVNSAYDTSGNGGRKLVRLDNGWLVCCVNSSNTTTYIYKSEDEGLTWTQVCYISLFDQNKIGETIVSYGNNVYVICNSQNQYIRGWKIDVENQTNIDIGGNHKNLDAGQTSIGNCSLTINSTETELHACWSSKNATYPNSFNIRYSKSTDGGATWATPTQITKFNTVSDSFDTPSIIIDKLGYVHIIAIATDTSNKYVVDLTNNPSVVGNYGTSVVNTPWNCKFIFTANGYAQYNPTATVGSNGVIHVAWHGKDATQNYNHIRYSKSTDNGATWSAMEKITNGTIWNNLNASICTNNLNHVFIMYDGFDGSNTAIRLLTYNLSAWSDVLIKGSGSASYSIRYPATCDNYKNFEKPLTIWQNNQTTNVEFYGKWTSQADAQLTKNVVRMNISPYINCSEIQAWLTKSELTGFTVDGKASFKALSTDDESYIDLVETVTDLGSTNEVSMTGVSTVPSKYITLKLILQRANTSDVVTFTKLVGGVA